MIYKHTHALYIYFFLYSTVSVCMCCCRHYQTITCWCAFLLCHGGFWLIICHGVRKRTIGNQLPVKNLHYIIAFGNIKTGVWLCVGSCCSSTADWWQLWIDWHVRHRHTVPPLEGLMMWSVCSCCYWTLDLSPQPQDLSLPLPLPRETFTV